MKGLRQQLTLPETCLFYFFSFPHFEVDENETLSEGGHTWL